MYKAKISDMAAPLDHADSDGLLRDSGAGDSQTMHSNGLLCAFRRTHVFSRAVGDIRRVQLWSSARRSLWLGGWCAASLGKSLCGDVAASSTPRGGGVASRNSEDTP